LIPQTWMSVTGASIGLYASALPTAAATVGLIGVGDVAAGTAAHCVILQDLTGASRRGVLANSYTSPTNYQTTAASSVAAAFEVISRVSATSSIFYRNGAQSGSTNTNTATGLASGDIGVFALRYGIGAGPYTNTNFSNMSARFYFAGLGLTATQAAALSARVNALMTAFGANVY